MNLIAGIVDQVYIEERIIIISINNGTQRISVSLDECLGILKSGDFVLFDGKKWYKNPKHDELKKELHDSIMKLYTENLNKKM